MQTNLLSPSLREPNYLMWHARAKFLRQVLAQELATRFSPSHPAQLLDLGAGTTPYRTLTKDLPVRWLSTDLKLHAATQTLLNAQTLPFCDDAFDIVLSTQVFEYVTDPFQAAREIYRVLKPNGLAILSAPALFPPYGDARWRIMPAGWKTLLRNFHACEIEAECNTIASFFRTLNLYLAILLQNVPFVEPVWRWLVLPPTNLVGRWANAHFHDKGFVANYVALARK